MKHARLILTGVVFGLLLSGAALYAQTSDNSNSNHPSMLAEEEKLVILWTSGDREVALKMVFMYTYNAKKYGWWDETMTTLMETLFKEGIYPNHQVRGLFNRKFSFNYLSPLHTIQPLMNETSSCFKITS